jgi:predicted RNA-binding protein YlqC (UPF0109 family)
MIQKLVEYIVAQLVENQDPLPTVTMEQREDALIVHIAVSQKDRGRVIGRDGQTVKALRAFLSTLVPVSTHVTIELTHPE